MTRILIIDPRSKQHTKQPAGTVGGKEDTMDDNKLKALLDEMESKKKQAESIAQMKAMDFVKNNDQQDRVSSQQYLHDADIWREAATLVRKHRAG